ncbi:MAG: hypothetical protein H0X37_13625 [Herpetosiphonaceae bacterium]|nr:hypothetical protein [Herpetosiphonaceae bacterium]
MKIGRITSLTMLSSLLLSLLVAMPAGAAPRAGTQQIPVRLKSLGKTSLLALGSAAKPNAAAQGPEFINHPEYDITRSGAPRAGAPTKPPKPASSTVTTRHAGFTGFNGISHLDQRNASSGNQFSLEPPDQALCVGSGFILEGVNDALRTYTTDGTPVSDVTAINAFFGLPPNINRTPGATNIYGPFVSDPKCYFDPATSRFFVTTLEIDVDPATGNFATNSHTLIAVSQSSDPRGLFSLYSLDTTNDGTNGTPSDPGCPCLGDQPLIGADQNGFYISNNEFPLVGSGFNGAQIYAFPKLAFETGTTVNGVLFHNLSLAEGQAYSVQPSTSPTLSEQSTKNGGTEFFLSALQFTGTYDNRIAVWRLLNTSSLNSSQPKLTLVSSIHTSETYGQPPNAEQRLGPVGSRPLGESLGEPLEQLAGNDDRMNQVVLAGDTLYSGVNTVVKSADSTLRIGIAYFEVKVGQLSSTISNQGYLSVSGNNVMFPSIGVNANGQAIMTFTLVGPDYYPSAAYAKLGGAGAPNIHLVGAGSGPDDGFSGYVAYGGAGVGRWGDYSAAVAGPDGSIYMAAEYIPNTSRTSLANWGTFISIVKPQ